MASFIENVNNIAQKLDIIVESNEIFDDGVIPILEEIAALDLEEAVADLKKGNYLGNRKIDINLALNMQGITEDLLETDPDAAEAIWTDPTKTVQYDQAVITFVDGDVITLDFEFDNNPITVSTHADLISQLNRVDIIDAVAQVDTVSSVVAMNSTLYTITINGIAFDYTSDVDATVAEILAGLVQEINVTQTNGSVPVTAAVVGTTITLTADVAGTAFTTSVNSNMSVATTTANVEYELVQNDFLIKLESTLISGFASPVVGEFVRLYDVIGENSNVERIRLRAVSGAYIEEVPRYYWAKTTSAFQTLSMRAGDIIKIGNDIDSIILLANSIEQVLEIQARIPEFIDTFVDGVPQGDVTIYNKLAELDAIYQELTGIITVYNDIKVGGTNYVNSVATDLQGSNNISTVAADLNLGASSTINIVAANIDDVVTVSTDISNVNTNALNIIDINTVAGSIGNINTTAANIDDVSTVASNTVNINTVATQNTNITNIANQIVPNITEILLADTNAAIATTKAAEATAARDQVIGIDGVQVTNTLTAGSSATAYYNAGTGKFTFGIPQGVKGDKGDAFAVNAVGLIAGRSIYDTQTAGFSFLALDESLIYFKLSTTSGDWSAGAPFGKGDTGNGIDNISFSSTTAVSGLPAEAGETDTYTITYTDATVDTFIVTNGLGIDSILFTSTTDGSGLVAQSGATDTYTITYSDATTDTIQVYNGLDSDVQTVAGRTGDVVLTKSDVGLANVDNTSDEDKPVSTAQANIFAAKEDIGTITDFEGALA